ncbi:hypothetical protein [Streptomyces cyaneofuscatus]|uniref:hypothetical protein n=1 Tax=Streptomyces cyaneofuscatus TaxID=66883 RepID=UPI00365C6D09
MGAANAGEDVSCGVPGLLCRPEGVGAKASAVGWRVPSVVELLLVYRVADAENV